MKNIPTFENFLNEAKSFKITDFPVDAIVHFKDGEAWKVIKPSGMSGLFNRRRSADEITIKPYNDLAKKKNVSLPINATLDFLNRELDKIEK